MITTTILKAGPGQLVEYLPELDVDALAEALYRALTDSALREQLIASGLARAKTFTWEKTARETLALYERVLGK